MKHHLLQLDKAAKNIILGITLRFSYRYVWFKLKYKWKYTTAYPMVQEVVQQLEEPSQYMSIQVTRGLHYKNKICLTIKHKWSAWIVSIDCKRQVEANTLSL